MKKRHYYLVPIILLLVVIVAGWFATDSFVNKARQEVIAESRASSLTLSIYVSSTLKKFEEAVQTLAGSPRIAPALESRRSQGKRDMEYADNALDRYNSSFHATVSYLMDAEGMIVASSNRNDSNSFVGQSYRFRPYFQEALRGNPSRYFAQGMTSGERGFYASHPVRNRFGNVVGVVTMKKDLDEIETFFNKYPFCFLISRDGIIFLSSRPAMVLKSLWPLDQATQGTLMASRQFGDKPFEAVSNKEITDGTDVTLEGNTYFVSRKVIDYDGWSIVLMTSSDRISTYKFISILITILVCLLIVIFSGVLYAVDRSRQAVQQREENKRLLLLAAGDGIFGVDSQGQLTFINPAALRKLGFAEEELSGRKIHAVIHHSHADGSFYPVEDCPMHASYTKGADSRIADELLWRKDGSSFPVEYSSMPIIKDDVVMGAVVTFRDITERQQTEEALKMSEEKYRNLFEGSRDAIMTLAPPAWSFIAGNPATLEMFAVADEAAFRALGPWDLSPEFQPDGSPSSEKAAEMIQTAMAKGYHFFEWTHRRRGGESFPATVLLTRMTIGGQTLLQATVRDMTEQKKADEKIRQMAYHDTLTGLPNRKLFSDRLGVALAQAQRNQKKVGIAMLDLDHFKNVNDTLGHDVGDLLLKETTERLSAALRKGDTVARFAGDEFLLLLPELKASEDAVPVAQKIVDGFRTPFLIGAHQLAVTTSIGIAVYPDNGGDEGILLKNADIAMYEAKRAGGGRYQISNNR